MNNHNQPPKIPYHNRKNKVTSPTLLVDNKHNPAPLSKPDSNNLAIAHTQQKSDPTPLTFITDKQQTTATQATQWYITLNHRLYTFAEKKLPSDIFTHLETTKNEFSQCLLSCHDQPEVLKFLMPEINEYYNSKPNNDEKYSDQDLFKKYVNECSATPSYRSIIVFCAKQAIDCFVFDQSSPTPLGYIYKMNKKSVYFLLKDKQLLILDRQLSDEKQLFPMEKTHLLDSPPRKISIHSPKQKDTLIKPTPIENKENFESKDSTFINDIKINTILNNPKLRDYYEAIKITLTSTINTATVLLSGNITNNAKTPLQHILHLLNQVIGNLPFISTISNSIESLVKIFQEKENLAKINLLCRFFSNTEILNGLIQNIARDLTWEQKETLVITAEKKGAIALIQHKFYPDYISNETQRLAYKHCQKIVNLILKEKLKQPTKLKDSQKITAVILKDLTKINFSQWLFRAVKNISEHYNGSRVALAKTLSRNQSETEILSQVIADYRDACARHTEKAHQLLSKDDFNNFAKYLAGFGTRIFHNHYSRILAKILKVYANEKAFKFTDEIAEKENRLALNNILESLKYIKGDRFNYPNIFEVRPELCFNPIDTDIINQLNKSEKFAYNTCLQIKSLIDEVEKAYPGRRFCKRNHAPNIEKMMNDIIQHLEEAKNKVINSLVPLKYISPFEECYFKIIATLQDQWDAKLLNKYKTRDSSANKEFIEYLHRCGVASGEKYYKTLAILLNQFMPAAIQSPIMHNNGCGFFSSTTDNKVEKIDHKKTLSYLNSDKARDILERKPTPF